MRLLRFYSVAIGLALLVTAFGVSVTGARASTKHAIEIVVKYMGRPAPEAHVDVLRTEDRLMIEKFEVGHDGTRTFMMPEIEGQYCFYSYYRSRESYKECYENEYPATVEITIH